MDRARRDIFSRPGSLYYALLRHAGCEAGDVEALLRREGLEGALERLFRAGVYPTVDEFKGRAPLVRGSLRLEVRTEHLRSPRAAHQLRAASGAAPARAPRCSLTSGSRLRRQLADPGGRVGWRLVAGG